MPCLVVEDDPDIRSDLVRALKAAGFLTTGVADGETAWYLGDVEDIDVAILDLGLPSPRRALDAPALAGWTSKALAGPGLVHRQGHRGSVGRRVACPRLAPGRPQCGHTLACRPGRHDLRLDRENRRPPTGRSGRLVEALLAQGAMSERLRGQRIEQVLEVALRSNASMREP